METENNLKLFKAATKLFPPFPVLLFLTGIRYFIEMCLQKYLVNWDQNK